MKSVEVLAPAGSMEAFKAALAHGADAIYLGEKNFSARAHAQNFSLEEIQDAVNLAHIYGVKVHVAMNTLLADQELLPAVDLAKKLAKIGVDALIVQDLGLIRLLRSVLPYMELHASTQLTIHNVQGARLCKEMGLSRVVLSRETPLEEIKRIKEEVDIELEVFVHGALCVCYSGQCTMSSYIGGRSGNRGNCAQPCRKSYKIIQGGKVLKDAYVLSPKDLWTMDDLKKYLDLGVDSFKIEGRMKKPSYVAYVTEMVAKACYGQRDKNLEVKAKESFNRGFTKGRSLGAFGWDFISKDHGRNRGVCVGRVLKDNSEGVVLSQALKNGDGISYRDKEGFIRGFELDQDLPLGESSLNFPYPPKRGAEIYRTFNSHLENFLENDLRPLPLVGEVFIQRGKPIGLKLDSPYEISVQGEFPEEAKKAPLSKEKVQSQLEKLGDTPFFWEKLKINLDPGLFLSLKDLNALRRDLVEEIFKKVNKEEEGNFKEGKLPDLVAEKPLKGKKTLYLENQEILKEVTPNQLREMDRIFTPDLEVIEALQGLNPNVYYCLPPIVDYIQGEKERDLARSLFQEGKIVGVEARTLWPFAYKKDFKDLKIHAGMGTGAFNQQSISMLRDLGADSIEISYEATYWQARDMVDACGGDLSTLYYGFLTGMIMDHCPNSLVKNCQDPYHCAGCPLGDVCFLEDEKGVKFPFRRQGFITRIYNSLPLYLGDKKKNYERNNIGLRVEGQFPNEPLEPILESLFDRGKDCKNLLKDTYKGWTYGHYQRGILRKDPS